MIVDFFTILLDGGENMKIYCPRLVWLLKGNAIG